MTTPNVGQVVLDRYRIDRALGTGSFSQVYSAFDQQHRRAVALKWLRPEAASEGAWLRHEFALLSGVEHESVVEVYDFHEDPALGSFFSMRLCEQRDFLSAAPGADQAWFIHVSAQVLSALAHLHAQGIVHCDLKPENILVDDQRRVTLVDFGLALEPRRLREERPRGTLRYVAPEALRGDGDARLDLFAYGRVLLEALLGRALGDDVDNAPVVERLPHMSEGFSHWVARLAHPSLEQRFASARAALAALEMLAPIAPSQVPALSRLPWPVVGREAEVRQAQGVVQRAINTCRAQLCVITGAHGLGKTQLSKSIAAQCRRDMVGVLRLERHDAEARLSPQSHDFSAIQQRALSCLRDVEHCPVWVIDDADRLTPPAWDVLWRIMELSEERAFCVLLTCTEGSHSTRFSSAEVLLGERAHRLELHPFTRRDVERLAHRALGQALPERWVSALFEAGAGVPLLTRQVLDAWYADGLLQREDLENDAPQLPPLDTHGFLHAHVLQRLSSIDETLWPLVFAASVLGRELTTARLDGLARAAGLDEGLTQPALDAMVQQALLERMPTGVRFVHESYIKALRSLIPPPKKQTLHYYAAALFDDVELVDFHMLRGTDARAAASAALLSARRALLRHDHRRALARLTRGYERAPSFILAFEAARTALHHGDKAAAREWLGRALKHPREEGDDIRCELLEAELSFHFAQHQRAAELARRVLHGSRDLEHTGRALALLARIERELGQTSEAAAWLDQLARLCPDDAELALQRAELALLRGRQDETEQHLEQADASLGEGSPVELRAALYLTRGQWLSEGGQYWLALDYLNEARVLARQVGDRLCEARALKALALIRRQQGQYDLARELNHRARRSFLAHDARGDLADCAFELAKLEARTADYGLALDHLAEVLAVRRERHDALGRAHAQASLARVHLDLGLVRETLHYAELAMRQAQRSNDPALALYAEVLLITGECYGGGRLGAVFTALAERARRLGIVRLEVSVLTRALIEGAATAPLVARTEEVSRTIDSRETRLLATWARGVDALRRNALDEAIAALTTATRLAQPDEQRELRVRIQSDLGDALLRAARPRDALACLVLAMDETRTIYKKLPLAKNAGYLKVPWRALLRARFQRSTTETG